MSILNQASYVRDRILVDLNSDLNRHLYFIKGKIETNARFNIKDSLYVFESPFDKELLTKIIQELRGNGYTVTLKKVEEFIVFKISI